MIGLGGRSLAEEEVPAPGNELANVQTSTGCLMGLPLSKALAAMVSKVLTLAWPGHCSDRATSGAGFFFENKIAGSSVQYEGDISSGLANGAGKLLYSNGVTISGTFKNGVPEGQVTFIDPDGFRYDGG
jgi:hypothetical protein